MYQFSSFPERRQTDSAKWNVHPEDVLPLWVADMDFLSAPEITKAIQERVRHGVFGYPFPQDTHMQIVVDWVERHYDWKISPTDLVFLPGVVPGLNIAARAFTHPGDSIAISTPTYGPFRTIHNNNNISSVDIPLQRNQMGDYYQDWDELRTCLSDETKIYYLCNPQNPTGKVYSREELTELADICLETETILCSDEIHCDLVYNGHKHIPIASIDPEISNRTITLIAPSKTFNIAGLKASVAIIENAELRKDFEKAMSGFVGWINIVGLIAMITAYSKCDSWLTELLSTLGANCDYVHQRINGINGLSMNKPQATYLAWIKTDFGLESGTPADFFITEAKVALNDGQWFGENGKDHVRLNFGTTRSVLENALDKMEKAILQLN